MEENTSGGSRRVLVGCGSILGLLIICVACIVLGYVFLPENYTDFTVGDTNIAQLLGLTKVAGTPSETPITTPESPPSESGSTPRPTFTLTPTPTDTQIPVRGSPTLPPTDTPRPKTPTSTPTPTNTPVTPTPTLEPEVQAKLEQLEQGAAITATQVAQAMLDIITGPAAIEGAINLVTIDNGHVFAPGIGEVEFSWIWTGADGCVPPPDGYGFDLRIWPDRPDFGPLGVDKVATLQEAIACIPETGRRVYRLGYLSGTPAVKAQGAGFFLWDVALVQINPYTPLYASPPRRFEISLIYPQPGRFDPLGEAGVVKCSDFGAWAEAQAFFNAAGGNDPHNLDPDRNGVACDAIAPDLLKE